MSVLYRPLHGSQKIFVPFAHSVHMIFLDSIYRIPAMKESRTNETMILRVASDLIKRLDLQQVQDVDFLNIDVYALYLIINDDIEKKNGNEDEGTIQNNIKRDIDARTTAKAVGFEKEKKCSAANCERRTR